MYNNFKSMAGIEPSTADSVSEHATHTAPNVLELEISWQWLTICESCLVKASKAFR